MPGEMVPTPVFVLHWNRPQECIRTVQAILEQSLPLSVRVVDNASSPEALTSLTQGLPAGVSVIHMEENRGWGGAFNVVLRNWLQTETGEFCIISAHDALPEAGSLGLLVESMVNDSRLGIACPEYGESVVPEFSKLHYVRITPVHQRQRGTVEPVDLPNGTLMLFRRQCLEEIGLFDERYFAYGDEHEIGLRARRNKWKVGIVWGSVVLNPGTWTLSSTRSYLFARNSLLLVRTYAGRWAALLRLLLMAPNTFRMWLVPPSDGYAFSARARFAGMQDYLLGRFGAPPR